LHRRASENNDCRVSFSFRRVPISAYIPPLLPYTPHLGEERFLFPFVSFAGFFFPFFFLFFFFFFFFFFFANRRTKHSSSSLSKFLAVNLRD